MAKKPGPRPNEGKGIHDTGGARVKLDSVKFALICERYAESGAAIKSCEDLGFNYNTVMNAIKSQLALGDETWQELWDDSYAKFKESLDQEIIRRGRDGRPRKWLTDKEGKPVLDAEGKMIVTEVEYSDRMLELAAKGHFPERYRERIAVSGTLGLEPVDAFANLQPKTKRAIRKLIMEDMEEQRQMEAARATAIEGTFTEVHADVLDDLREQQREEDDQ